MSGTKGSIVEAIGDITPELDILSNVLDNKLEIQQLWRSKGGKTLLTSLQRDSTSILNRLLSFETLSEKEIVCYLAQIRSNMKLLSTLKETSNVDEIQEMLDKEILEVARLRRSTR